MFWGLIIGGFFGLKMIADAWSGRLYLETSVWLLLGIAIAVIVVSSFLLAQFAPGFVGIAAVAIQIGCGVAAIISLFKAEWAFAIALLGITLLLALPGVAARAIRDSQPFPFRRP